ncbi:hypothetical protein PZB75_00505 [Streptomyces sp. AM 4-1-1]|uniref:hypothetical protein n=1 Tax=Streptomyces sp. AM 4-1-1 TaxID=3028710 RepID=UPI0023B9296F|nr:hypothetical protein [Streptomyces sp. AM 4-1-1]WEH31991.1 hypothetical protein PZB75_00505 [Streptomyces sp. AM 4-1-1]
MSLFDQFTRRTADITAQLTIRFTAPVPPVEHGTADPWASSYTGPVGSADRPCRVSTPAKRAYADAVPCG